MKNNRVGSVKTYKSLDPLAAELENARAHLLGGQYKAALKADAELLLYLHKMERRLARLERLVKARGGGR